MYFTYKEAKDLLELFAEDPEVEILVTHVLRHEPSHSGPGLYASYCEYPDEGSFLLGDGRNEKEIEV